MSRKILFSAVALVTVKVATLVFHLPKVIAGAAEIGIGVLVVVAFLMAARRSESFGRQFWQLLSIAFIAWTLAHFAVVYRRDIQGSTVSSDYWSVVLLFFIFGIPFAATLFLRERRDVRKIYFRELLDFLQLGLLVFSLFLAFAYVPFLEDPSRRIIIDKSFSLHLVRDGALLLGFLGRGYSSRSAAVRYLFKRVSIYLFLYMAGSGLYFYGEAHWPRSGTITDLVSDLVRVSAIALAITSAAPHEVPSQRSSHRSSRMLWIQLLLFPTLIVILIPRIAAANTLAAALLLVTSILCVCARLYLAERGARRFADSLRESEQRFRKLAEGISAGSGETLFRSLAQHAADATGATYSLIGELKPGTRSIQTVAAFGKGAPLPNFEYALVGTPCDNVMGNAICFYPSDVATLFPDDHLLAEMGVSAYIGAPLFRSDGEPLGIFVVLKDSPFPEPEMARSILQICATRAARELERERDAKAIRESEAKLGLAFKFSPSPIFVGRWGQFSVSVGNEIQTGRLQLIAISDSLVEFFGLPREKIIGRTPREISQLRTVDPNVDLIQTVEERRSFKDLELLITVAGGETRRVLLSGQLFEVGSQTYLLGTMDDITEEHAARQQLERSEKNYRTLFEDASDILFTCDERGYFLTLNRAGRKLYNVHEKDIRSRRCGDIIEPQGKLQLQKHLELAFEGQPSEIFELQFDTKGVTGSLELSLQAISADGAMTVVQGIARDVTDRKVLEKKIAQSQRLEAVGTFAAGVAHDFNNVLTVIAGYSGLAIDQVSDPTVRAELEEIRSATRRAAALTNQLLMFSRKQVSQPRVLDLNDSVRSMYRLLQRIVGEDVVLDINLDAAGAPVMADPVQIDQIIMNLAANARDAMRTGGRLTLSTSNLRLRERDPKLELEANEYSVMTVSDSGSGMSENTMAHIFEPFFTTKEVGKGTGLGLATVYGAIKQAKGHITVASELGRGTTFTIYFPAARTAAVREAGAAEERDAGGTETLLLVEDDDSLRALTQNILDSAGYKVYSCVGVEAAENMVSEIGSQLDLLVTDVVMPDGGGVDLAHRVSARFPQLRVLFISGYTDGRLPETSLIEGRTGFLAKPYQPAQLRAKVREILDAKTQVNAAAAGEQPGAGH